MKILSNEISSIKFLMRHQSYFFKAKSTKMIPNDSKKIYVTDPVPSILHALFKCLLILYKPLN